MSDVQARDAREPCASFWTAKDIKQPKIVLSEPKSAKRSQFNHDRAVAWRDGQSIEARVNRTGAASEFMPFAPVITTDKAATVFDVNPVNAYACRFMTITCNVKPEWRDRIAAVVHVDGSARPQIIEREPKPAV
jgi:hypothetical protein